MTPTRHSELPCHRTQRQLRRWLVFTLGLAVLSIGLSITLDQIGELPNTLRFGAIGMAALLIAFWVLTSIRFQRSLDEMQRRIFLEVTSIVGIAAIAWLYLFPVLEKTGIVRPMTHDGYALAVIPISLLAWLFTTRRYQ